VGSLLLDTHALYWYEAGAPQLSSRAGRHADSASPLTVSATSIWEMAIGAVAWLW
jgi:PIN domain nuclease of toxin-antitoxin system